MRPDVFFVACPNPDTERNRARLTAAAPHARRIDFQPGIREAYVACGAASRTPYCFMVDGDNWLADGFGFAFDFEPRPDQVAVWRARNPVNGLTYGNGGIKLLPAALVRAAPRAGAIDVGTSLGVAYRVVDVVASEHRFNTSGFAAWRTAFRECVKLSANVIRGGDPAVAASRLEVWCADAAEAVPFAADCVAGARAGRAYGRRHAGDWDALRLVNDFAWLRRVWAARGAGDASG